MEEYVIRLEGKDLTSLTGSVKGILQGYVRSTHKYENAAIDIHRREGTILVKGVPQNVIEEGLRVAQGRLVPEKRFTYEVEAAERLTRPEQPSVDPEAKTAARYESMLEIERKQFGQQIAGYEGELHRLTTEGDDLRRKMSTLAELRRQDQEQLTSLKKSYDELSRLLERVTGERARSPLDMADSWVSDWSASARQLDQKISESVGDEWPAVEPLLKFDATALREAIRSEAPTDPVPEDVDALERLGSASTWEDTDGYRRLRPAYEKAKSERDYIDSLEAGDVVMPDALKETLLKAVDRAALDSAILQYEGEKAAHRERTAASNRISQLVHRYKRAESLRRLLGGRENMVPVAVVCRSGEEGYRIESIFPRSDGPTLRATLEQVVERAVHEGADRTPEVVEEEAVIRVGARMSGKYKGWKEASRQQEVACLQLARAFRDSPLHALGFRLDAVKVMVGPDGSLG